MCKEGFRHRTSAKAVVFIPSAFARIHFKNAPYEFPACYYPSLAAYRRGRLRRYDLEPVFIAALALAKQMCSDGACVEVERIAQISAEYKSIATALENGLSPTKFNFAICEF